MALHNCKSCVNYRANSTFAVPACAALNQVLGTNRDQDNPSVLEAFSDSCGRFEEGTPVTTMLSVTAVNIGSNLDGSIKASQAATQNPGREKPMTCTQCKYWATPQTVMKELGWTPGMCTAKGDLVLQSETHNYASVCAIGEVGVNAVTTADVRLDRKYSGMSVNVGSKKSSLSLPSFDPLRHIKTDPRDWVTDYPVSPEDQADGVIAAWRRVDDPSGQMPALKMPIFNWKALGINRDPRESYGEHTPHLYEDYAGLLYWFAFLYGGQWSDIEAGEKGLNETLMLLGEAGTGKTEFWCYVAWLMDLPFTRISLRPDTESLEFFGSPDLVVNPEGIQVTVFTPGRYTRKYVSPGVVCLDEPNAANDSIWFLLRPTLDSAGQFVNEQTDEVFKKDPLCFVGLAGNPSYNPLYTGTRPLSAADSSRLSKRFVELPPEEVERRIVKAHCAAVGYDIPPTTLDRLFRIATEIRVQYKNKSSNLPWGIRDQVKVAKMTWGFPMLDAFRTAVLDELDPAIADAVRLVITANS